MNILDIVRVRPAIRKGADSQRRKATSLRPWVDGLEDRIVLTTYPTASALAITPGPIEVYGTDLKLSATVRTTNNASVPGGTVTFYDGNSVIGSSKVSASTASLSTSTLAIGPHSIKAVYSGFTIMTSTGSGPLPDPSNGRIGIVPKPTTMLDTYLGSTSATSVETITAPSNPPAPPSTPPAPPSTPPTPTPPTSPTTPATPSIGTSAQPMSVDSGDLNGDGHPDLVVSSHAGAAVDVMLNKGDGTFGAKTSYDAGPNADVVKLADVNCDKHLDIVAMNWDGTVSILLGKGNGTFATKVSYQDAGASQTGMVVTDVNGDGKPDIVTSKYYNPSQAVNVLINQGNGTFAAPVNYAGASSAMGVTAGDVNGDGKPDLIAAGGDDRSVGVYLNKGNGTFAPEVRYGVGNQPGNVVVGDVNGDGKLDIVAANTTDNTVSVLTNLGNGTFGTQSVFATGKNPSGLVLADMDGDGKLDIVVANRNDNTASLLKNNGSGGFVARTSIATGATPVGLAVNDLDGDGKPDLVVTNRDDNTITVALKPRFA